MSKRGKHTSKVGRKGRKRQKPHKTPPNPALVRGGDTHTRTDHMRDPRQREALVNFAKAIGLTEREWNALSETERRRHLDVNLRKMREDEEREKVESLEDVGLEGVEGASELNESLRSWLAHAEANGLTQDEAFETLRDFMRRRLGVHPDALQPGFATWTVRERRVALVKLILEKMKTHELGMTEFWAAMEDEALDAVIDKFLHADELALTEVTRVFGRNTVEDLFRGGWLDRHPVEGIQWSVSMLERQHERERLKKAARAATDEEREDVPTHEEVGEWLGAPTHLEIEQEDGVTIRLPVIDAKQAGLWMPTPTLKRLSRIARDDEGSDYALDEATLAQLAPLGRHLVSSAAVQRRETDGHHFVSARLLLRVRDPEVPGAELEEPQEAMAELPLKQFGMLMEGMGVTQPAQKYIDDWADVGRHIPPPMRAGAHTFGETWKVLDHLGREAMRWSNLRGRPDNKSLVEDWDGLVDIATSPSTLVGIDALNRMAQAQVISLDLDVFEALPEWENLDETLLFARDVELPFETVFLDFGTVGGLAPILSIPTDKDDMPVILRGALMYRDSRHQLVIAPIGWPGDFNANRANGDAAPMGRFTSFEIAGRVTFTHEYQDDPVEWVRLKAPEGELEAVQALVPSVDLRSLIEGEGLAIPARIETVPVPHDIITTEYPEDDDRNMLAWASIVFHMAARSLSALYLLDSTVNVELVEATPNKEERRGLKRAEKRGWDAEIALQVDVRPTRYQVDEPEDENGEEKPRRIYSHAFWRRGGYAFYPLGTRLADAQAERDSTKLVNHPAKGLCRKIYRGPTIIGKYDEDGTERKPVIKTRVWKTRPPGIPRGEERDAA